MYFHDIEKDLEELGFEIVKEDMDGINRCKTCGDCEDNLGFTSEGNCSICSYNLAIHEFNQKYCG